MDLSGQIMAVCISSVGGVPKYPQSQVILGPYGFEGDYHCRPELESHSKPGTMVPNTDRHITIVSHEAVTQANRKMRLNLGYGALGENILTFGLGTLSKVPKGALVFIGEEIELEVTEQNKPCRKLWRYGGPSYVQAIKGKRGLLCAVVRGIGRSIRARDKIEIGW